MLKRCGWVNPDNATYCTYHDQEWGVPVHEEQKLFEMLILEGAQAGLSWEIILKKRTHYQEAFDYFDPKKVALYTPIQQAALLQNKGIVRNRLKIQAAVRNAQAFLAIQKTWGSFDQYIWHFVDCQPIQNNFQTQADIPARTPLSDTIAKDLKKQGMTFVGSTIIYAFMQAIGMVNDHEVSCYRHAAVNHSRLKP